LFGKIQQIALMMVRNQSGILPRQSRSANSITTSTSILLLAIIAITIVHYVTRQEESSLHVIFRELYFIPIILAGFWFGLRGGLTTSILISVLYLPIAIGVPDHSAGHKLGNLLQIILFNVTGILVGWLQDREFQHQETKRQEDGLIKIGKAVSCIAHDMKTPLLVIEGFSRQIRKTIKDDDRLLKKIDLIVRQSQRLEVMVQDMLKFTGPLTLDCGQNSLSSLFDETLILIDEKARTHKVQISCQLEDDVQICAFDYHRMQQALVNLLNNAIDASPTGGAVVLRCARTRDNIVIEVEDSGDGIKGVSENEILEPFCTSKKEGTGLGLPIVKRIIEAHNGTLEYEVKGGQGMIFRMMFPGTFPH
jgi:signal transduction histidine kinase